MKLSSLTKPFITAACTIAFFSMSSPADAHLVFAEKDDSGLTVDSYEPKTIQGWTVNIEKAAFGHKRFKEAQTELENQLKNIVAIINPEIVTKLQEVPIWLNNDIRSRACYHPDAKWLKENNRMPEKVRSVELQSVNSFLNSSKNQPMLMLHELSHAFHHRIHNFENPVITKAFEKAVASKSYEKVKHIGGRTVKHYALSNEKEYFAELTEAYFGKNDYYPFNRAELKKHDPIGYEMVKILWKVK